jgi:hypothetical protein
MPPSPAAPALDLVYGGAGAGVTALAFTRAGAAPRARGLLGGAAAGAVLWHDGRGVPGRAATVRLEPHSVRGAGGGEGA